MATLRNNRRRRFSLLVFLVSALCLLTACGEKSIASTDNELEANIMFGVLHSRSLHVEKVQKDGEKPGWEIVIDEGWFGENEAAAAMQVLTNHGLPRRKESLPEASNPYGMTTDKEARKRQNREKEIQIADHLYALPGVITVSVIVAQPEKDILSLDKTPPTASILIVYTEPEPKFTQSDVQKIVSGTVPELKPENIVVSFSEQALREIPLAQLEMQRRTNKIFALGTGLIILLVAALAAVWLMTKRRRRLAEANFREIAAKNEFEELAAASNQSALKAANDDVL